MPKALGFHRRPDVVDARSRALRLQEGEFIELQCRADVVVGPLDASPAASTGALFITTLRVAFVPDTAHGDGDGDGDAFEMNYQSIALHAVSRADAAHAQRGCVYCHIDGGAEDAPARDDDDDDDDDDEASVEVRFVPHEPTTVDSVFAALSACAELNPDTEDEDEDGDEEDGYYYDESSVLADDIDGSKRAALESYDGKLVMPNADELDALLNQPGRFADAEDA